MLSLYKRLIRMKKNRRLLVPEPINRSMTSPTSAWYLGERVMREVGEKPC